MCDVASFSVPVSSSDPGAADKGLHWNSLPFGEFLWIRMGIHLRIYKDSPNSTEFQGMNRTPFFDPKKGVPYQRLSPQSGSDGEPGGAPK